MIRIRSEQMETFDRGTEAANVAELREYAEERYASVIRPFAASLDNLLVATVRKAGQHGIELLESHILLLQIIAAAGEDFDDEPQIAQVLADTTVPPDGRLGVLLALCPIDGWAELCRNNRQKKRTSPGTRPA